MLQKFKNAPRKSLLLISAQSASMLGTFLTNFGLNVWVYKHTGSYAIFAIIAFVTALPGILFSPFAGVIADRFSRKKVLIGCEAVAGATTLLILLASYFDFLSPVLVGFLGVVLGLVNTVGWPTTMAAVTDLTPSEQLPAVNGIAESYNGVIQVLGPVAGAALFTLIGIPGIVTIDVLSYALCIALILGIAFPVIAASNDKPAAPSGMSQWRALIKDAGFGFHWIAARRDLLTLLLFFAMINVGGSIFLVTLTPYILSFSSPDVLGLCFGLMGGGMIAGGSLFAATGGTKRKEMGVLFGALFCATVMFMTGVVRIPLALEACLFLYGMSIPIMNASSQTIWQREVPSTMQGRVFAIRKMIAWSVNPISILVSIPLATALFAPLLSLGAGSVTLGQLWGSSQAGALGLMSSACGALSFIVAASVLMMNGLRIQHAAVEAASETA